MTAPDGSSIDSLGPPSGGDEPSALPVCSGRPVTGRRVACGLAFLNAVEALATRRGCDAGALAAAALLLGGDARLAAVDDPGEGEAALLLPLPPDAVSLSDGAIRRLLALALRLADPAAWHLTAQEEGARLAARVETLEYRNKALANALERVSFQPLKDGVLRVRDAAQMFGFANEWCFDEDRVVRRFRELAPVYHPDTGVVACRERMAQLIEARNVLVRHVRTVYAAGSWPSHRQVV